MTQTTSYRFQVPKLSDVRITGGFWQQWQSAIREGSIPSVLDFLKSTGRIEAIKLAWKPGDEPKPHYFWDSDVAKWIEAAAYSMVHHPDDALMAEVDAVVALYEAAQGDDGYINSYFQAVEPHKRWKNLRDWHELYCAGHMIEAAVAYAENCGKHNFLRIMCRYADYIDRVFGPEDGKKHGYPGHEEIELALIRLGEYTGEPRYLRLAQYFINERGREPHYYTQEAIARGVNPNNWHWVTVDDEVAKVDYRYNQSHCPVSEQDTAVGHAVRAMYLYSGAADVAAKFDDPALKAAMERLFDSVTQRRMYITGGLGSAAANEGFTEDYDLPNDTAYVETCAAIGLIFWLQRMARFDSERKYIDVLERALYNAMLVGVSLDGKRFFYSSPLVVKRGETGEYSNFHGHRSAWFSCSCCPPNVARLVSSLGQYIYQYKTDEIAVHLFVESNASFALDHGKVHLQQTTQYPWDGKITLQVDVEEPQVFALRLRVPQWCNDQYQLKVNDEKVDGTRVNGYVRLQREWHAGDVVSYALSMQPRCEFAHPKVDNNQGRMVLAYGPMLYCLESIDQVNPLDQLVILRETLIDPVFKADLMGGVITLQGPGMLHGFDEDSPLYQSQPYPSYTSHFTAIPFAYWDNREEGDMQLWIRDS
ncbi:MAG: beta-L-arabinofuranosidase domain-containing protein [Anaerolineae bacterium]|jgi:DUF1680 family protein|nr:beta-L-arabinofuranosidase domain-containing protein [Anaerolineae bacterium]